MAARAASSSPVRLVGGCWRTCVAWVSLLCGWCQGQESPNGQKSQVTSVSSLLAAREGSRPPSQWITTVGPQSEELCEVQGLVLPILENPTGHPTPHEKTRGWSTPNLLLHGWTAGHSHCSGRDPALTSRPACQLFSPPCKSPSPVPPDYSLFSPHDSHMTRGKVHQTRSLWSQSPQVSPIALWVE